MDIEHIIEYKPTYVISLKQIRRSRSGEIIYKLKIDGNKISFSKLEEYVTELKKKYSIKIKVKY